MISVFIGPLKERIPYIPPLFPNLGALKDDRHLFADRGFREFTKKVFNLVEDVAKADFILLPYDYFYILEKNKDIVFEYVSLAEKSGKKLLIFDFSDYTERKIDIENAWIFRVAGYRKHLENNEIIMPYFVEDLSGDGGIFWREKGGIPVIGFCGWADFKDGAAKIKAHFKDWYFSIRRIFSGDADFRAHRQGLLLRRKLISALIGSEVIRTNFIIRRAYGSHKNTLELDPHEARNQYIGNIQGSDFTLSIRGDANFSQRFYEALSLGRIPVLIDTDCVLPLEDEIHYDEFMLRVNYRDISRLDTVISDFYRRLSDDNFKKMQHMARENFEKYLKADSFFDYVLPKLVNK